MLWEDLEGVGGEGGGRGDRDGEKKQKNKKQTHIFRIFHFSISYMLIYLLDPLHPQESGFTLRLLCNTEIT